MPKKEKNLKLKKNLKKRVKNLKLKKNFIKEQGR